MKNKTITFRVLALLAIIFAMATPAVAQKGAVGYQTGFNAWRASEDGFAAWTLAGISRAADGTLVMNSSAQSETDPYAAGAYYGGNFYNGGSYRVGSATSPEVTTPFSFTEAIASWNAITPSGTWVEVLMRAQVNGAWTKWYNMGVWASGTGTVQRHSVKLQGDTNGYVATDTLVISAKKAAATAYQLQVRLFSTDGIVSPTVRGMFATYSTTPEKKVTLQPGSPALWGKTLDVPECSQMVYPDGGNVWCSPTSVSMLMGYYGYMPGPCEPRVRDAVAGVYDWIYDGHGNWPFNTAYAAALGHEAYVIRYTSLAQLEPWTATGNPVVISLSWGKGELTNASIPASPGHLMLLVGFDTSGNPVVNDPAASADADVQRTYLRSELESLWLGTSGGTAYIIRP